MLGNVFSPFYARARAEGGGHDPLAFSAFNVALYGPSKTAAWALNERGRAEVHRAPHALSIGASSARWEGGDLVISLDEPDTPFLTSRLFKSGRIRGTVRVRPETAHGEPLAIDGEGKHLWWPVLPHARVEVEMHEPAIRWKGSGYHDANAGDGPLEETFRAWDWSRAQTRNGTVILYDVETVAGARTLHGRRIDARGGFHPVEAPRRCELPRSRWGVTRTTRTDAGGHATVQRTLEDTPFYARSVLTKRLYGEDVHAVHEALDLRRFREDWVRFLLPFRMRRV